MDSPPTVCPLMLVWAENDASIHHFSIPVPPAPRMNGIFTVLLRYFIRRSNFFQSSVSGYITLVLMNVTDVHVPGISLLVLHSVLETRL